MRSRLLPAVLFGALFPWSGAPAQQDARAALLEGVRSIAAPGTPGGVSVLGQTAFPVVAGPVGGGLQAPVVAAARWGRGRVVAFGHDGYFGTPALRKADTGRLVENAVRWLSAGAAPRVAVINGPQLAAHLRSAGLSATVASASVDLASCNVVAFTHDALAGDLPERLAAWIRSGGGVLAASTGWGWSQITGKPLSEHPGSRLLMPAGIIWNTATLSPRQGGTFGVPAEEPAPLHAGQALTRIRQGDLPREDVRQALNSCLLALGSLPPGESQFRDRIQQVVGRESPVPTKARPVGAADPVAALSLAVAVRKAQEAAPGQVQALPAAGDFPGSVPQTAPRITQTIGIDLMAPGWAGTGLYAAPGERVQVTLPEARARGTFRVRIGAHSDELWHLASWKRAPEITREFPLAGRTTQIASGFGGPIYIVVPENAGTGTLDVTIAGAVEAPWFRLDRTTPAEWRRQRARPAPWAELEGRRVVFTVPASAIRELVDPEPLIRLWDRLVESQEALISHPRRPRLERIVADRQISAGYMHSGYPIMTPIDGTMGDALNLAKLQSQGTWGHLHELGHNLQHPDWTFDGTGEVTNNVLVLYCFEKVLRLPFDSGHPEVRDRAARAAKVRRYVEAGSDFETWKREPFLALAMYIELIDRFGWGPLEKVFAEYRGLPAAERPKTDGEKRDQWLTRLSRATGSNLAPFFRRWGLLVTEQARAQVRGLPSWTGP